MTIPMYMYNYILEYLYTCVVVCLCTSEHLKLFLCKGKLLISSVELVKLLKIKVWTLTFLLK